MRISEGPYFPAFAVVTLPPPFFTLGLTSALASTAGVFGTGVKDPPRAFVSLTLSWAFIFLKTRGWLAPHPLPTGLPIGPSTLKLSGPDFLPPPSPPKGVTSVLTPIPGTV